MEQPKLTLGEKLAIIRLEARGVRRAAAGITHQPEIDRQIERIKERARKRPANGK
jgi:hypothetical protein